MTIEPDASVVSAIVIAFGAGGWATMQTIQVRALRRELRELRTEWTAFLERFERVAPYIARGQRASDRPGS